VIFVTAYDQYAVQAFAQGAVDYLIKAVDSTRLAEAVARLQERLREKLPVLDTDSLLEQLAARLRTNPQLAPLRWLRASVGQTVRLIAIDDVDFLRADEKYTLIAWRNGAGEPCEAVIRTPLKELIAQLDPTRFVQVHRSAVVNLRAIDHVVRGANETADIHLQGRDEVLPVSRSYLHFFRQM
jgi:DNA-binding LytR/AlgR family response regulator